MLLRLSPLNGRIDLKIFKIGASFSTANRRIEEWKVVE